jgi:hypothetical protein
MRINSALSPAEQLPGCLLALDPRCAPIGSQTWQLSLPNDSRNRVVVRLEEEWVELCCLQSRLELAAGYRQGWELLNHNGRLPGRLKYTLDRNGRIGIRAEHLLADALGVHRPLEESLAGLEFALLLLSGAHLDAPPSAVTAPCSVDLSPLCAAAGWPSTKRSEEQVVIELGEDHRPFPATLTALPTGVLALAIDLASFDELPLISKAALSVFLLRACHLLRLVHAEAVSESGTITVRLAVYWMGLPSPAELAHALGALAVGCRMCAAEASAFADETISADYLRWQGWPADSHIGSKN